MTTDVLLQNHLAFLGSHRGTVTRSDDGYAIESVRAEFTYVVALREGILEPGVRVAHRPDFSGVSREQLSTRGFRLVGTLNYMTRSTRGPEIAIDPRLRVEVAGTCDAADRFADIQTRGFFDSDEDRRQWLPFMRDAARRNVTAPDQTFYVGSVEDVPAGVTLTVQTEVVGIYAVATPASFRNRGLGTRLLSAALRDARDRGCEHATLQVVAGSYAESLYEKLGFESRFTSEIWQRE